MNRISDIHIASQRPLPSPGEMHAELPITPEMAEFVEQSRHTLIRILRGEDPRLLVITGPCSVSSESSVMEYAEKLNALRPEISDKIFPVMRLYFEKPRTTLGWKGMIYDPDLNGSCNIEKGLRTARRILSRITAMGIPAATEFLDPIIPQYLADMITWSAIGARTTESQTHRQLASGLSMPVGFKNSTDGAIEIAIDAIKTASAQHTFLGVISDGRTGIFHTRGNPNCHLVLRGSSSGPNYGSEYIAFASELLRKHGLPQTIVVDCSHGNSRKQPLKQFDAARDVLQQRKNGCRAICGIMLESFLQGGRQDISDHLIPGMSVTDACLSWDETKRLLLELAGR